jgi:hypothetical protein
MSRLLRPTQSFHDRSAASFDERVQGRPPKRLVVL